MKIINFLWRTDVGYDIMGSYYAGTESKQMDSLFTPRNNTLKHSSVSED